ncbi:DNA polymerase delta subunit 3-like [Ischnura elegans]|uniref:DNA polymerase delta subunit 3-like n=1 Tax=Ischnura elegans TaxID=197161 RepID=UPI001ED8BCB9|nr:DNA polymerase delta subunit 3-like [Ischnura elegans]
MGSVPENILSELESYVVSCDNTVTYKWISQKWNVHVNTAKQLLYSFLDKEKSKENPVSFEVIYFLSGPLKNASEGKSYQVCLVREKDIDKVKSQLQKVVSEHVYSIQKSTLKDLHALYVVDKANGDDILQGKSGKSAVKCEDAVPRAAEQVAPAASRNAVDNSKGNNLWNKSNGKSSTDSSRSSADIKNGKNSEASVPAQKDKKDASKGIAGMFAAQSGKTSNKKSETDADNASSKNDLIKKPTAKKSNGIASMFAKQAERPPAPKPKKEEPKKEEPKKTIVVDDEDPFASEEEEEVGKKGLLREEIDSEEDRAESPVKTKGKAKVAKGKATKEKKKRQKKHSDGEEESPLAPKKRRRIKMMASSDESSGEEMEVGESESPIPSKQKKAVKEIVSDDEDIIPATPQEAASGGSMGKKKIRKRVMVNKTFVDDQGFIVTKKEYAFESCSEDSNQSADDSKASKDSALHNGKINPVKEDGGGKNVAVNQKNGDLNKGKVDADSPSDENKGKNSKETAKGKKAAGKKVSPPSGRQGVLTSFFKRC